MNPILKYFFIFLFTILTFSQTKAYNLIIDKQAHIIERNTDENFCVISLDLQWNHSWRDTSNYDAVWLFFKYKEGEKGQWKHLYIPTDTSNYKTLNTNGIESEFNVGITDVEGIDRGVGVFMQRKQIGSGNINWDNIHIKLGMRSNKLNASDSITIKAYAIEMVYVPEGAFYLGDYNTSLNSFKDGSTNNPYIINSQSSIILGENGGELNWSTGKECGTAFGASDNKFPTGYDAFYCMKFEITQYQYAEFLNTLSSLQIINRFVSNSTEKYPITVKNKIFSGINPFLSCNYMSWADGIAYADWAGLRPMTELEYEKAARGKSKPVKGEYAWGTNTIMLMLGPSDTEKMIEKYEKKSKSFIKGNIGRTQTGASAWGIMDLSSGLFERIVTIGNDAGMLFTGIHGDGELTNEGSANVVRWPQDNALGSGFRGCDWTFSQELSRISTRCYAAFNFKERGLDFSFRAVRSVQ